MRTLVILLTARRWPRWTRRSWPWRRRACARTCTRRRTFLAGLSAFTLASLAGGLADVLPDETAGPTAEMMTRGIGVAKETLEAAARP